MPLGHLDLKADHCRRKHGRLMLIDAETLRPDLTGMPDLITLAHLATTDARVLSPTWVRQAYRRHTTQFGAQWSDAGLVNALRAFAAATGSTRCTASTNSPRRTACSTASPRS
ncbi:hypothetical protein [Streptomyces sp. NBC_00470]|uniref:hypothetical protein n=1 Tax=Streptomyces sp. NBC_00470 TaxID=2975753 RepID=UPI002F913D6C